MYAALFEIKSWLGLETHVFEGNTAVDILRELESIQNLDCLLEMGRIQEGEKGQRQLDKLEALLEKYCSKELTLSDLDGFELSLSVGDFRCVAVAEDEDAVLQLKQQIK